MVAASPPRPGIPLHPERRLTARVATGNPRLRVDRHCTTIRRHMSLFRVNVTAINPRQPERETPAVEALVDTGSELTWLPRKLLEQAGISPVRQRSFQTVTKEIIRRDIGYAILRAEGFETNDEVVFGESGDMSVLGVRTVEGFGVSIDNIGHRFVAQATLAV